MKNILYLMLIALSGLLLFSCVEDEPFPAPPLVTNFTQEPLNPEENDPVTVSADVADVNDLVSVKLFYKINDGSYTSVDMLKTGNTTKYSAIIPGQEIGTIVGYYIEAKNSIDKTTYFPATAPAEPQSYKIGGALLMYYWHFNDALIENEVVVSNYSIVGTGVISYPGDGAGYMDFRTYRTADPVSNFNLRLGEAPDQGAVLRVRNPANTRELIIEAPSAGFEKLVVTFATTRSDNGGQLQEFYYSADNGSNWVLVAQAYEVNPVNPESENFGYVHKSFDLSAITAVNNNPNLKFRIMSAGEGSDGSSGNQRFDNLSIDGEIL